VLGQATGDLGLTWLGGSHHLPPYSILYVTLREPHPNGTFSRDSQGGVLKLSQVELPGLWTLISPGSDLRLEWGLNQSCSSPQELSKASSHSFCRRREEVDSWLLVVGVSVWLLALLMPITWGADVQMAYARPFWTSTLQDLSNGIKNTLRQGVLPSAVELWNCGSPGGLQVPTLGSVSLILTLCPKWGCDIQAQEIKHINQNKTKCKLLCFEFL
jgi:hypothetical protein